MSLPHNQSSTTRIFSNSPAPSSVPSALSHSPGQDIYYTPIRHTPTAPASYVSDIDGASQLLAYHNFVVNYLNDLSYDNWPGLAFSTWAITLQSETSFELLMNLPPSSNAEEAFQLYKTRLEKVYIDSSRGIAPSETELDLAATRLCSVQNWARSSPSLLKNGGRPSSTNSWATGPISGTQSPRQHFLPSISSFSTQFTNFDISGSSQTETHITTPTSSLNPPSIHLTIPSSTIANPSSIIPNASSIFTEPSSIFTRPRSDAGSDSTDSLPEHDGRWRHPSNWALDIQRQRDALNQELSASMMGQMPQSPDPQQLEAFTKILVGSLVNITEQLPQKTSESFLKKLQSLVNGLLPKFSSPSRKASGSNTPAKLSPHSTPAITPTTEQVPNKSYFSFSKRSQTKDAGKRGETAPAPVIPAASRKMLNSVSYWADRLASLGIACELGIIEGPLPPIISPHSNQTATASYVFGCTVHRRHNEVQLCLTPTARLDLTVNVTGTEVEFDGTSVQRTNRMASLIAQACGELFPELDKDSDD